METGRKGRLKVIRSIKEKLRKPIGFDDLVRWLMRIHGYNKNGAIKLIGELDFAKIIRVRQGERDREGYRGYEVTRFSVRRRKRGVPVET